MVKVSSGVYNFKTYLEGGVILEEDNLKKATMFKVGDYIRGKIDEYEVENGIITPEAEEVEDELEEDLEEDEEDEENDDEALAMAQYKKETDLDAVTKKGSLRKDYLKWKENNWD